MNSVFLFCYLCNFLAMTLFLIFKLKKWAYTCRTSKHVFKKTLIYFAVPWTVAFIVIINIKLLIHEFSFSDQQTPDPKGKI